MIQNSKQMLSILHRIYWCNTHHMYGYSDCQKDEQHFICHVKVAVSPHFLSWIMNFGKQAKIISPDYVVHEMY